MNRKLKERIICAAWAVIYTVSTLLSSGGYVYATESGDSYVAGEADTESEDVDNSDGGRRQAYDYS